VSASAERHSFPAGLARSWVQVLSGPRQFFGSAVVPGNQGSGLVFGMAVVAVEETLRLVLVADAAPVLGGQRLLSGLLWLALAVFLVTPLVLHLVAALQTALLVPFVDDRGGVSETVQVLGYATAPCVLAGLPFPAVRVACTAWGAALLAWGISEVHGPRFEAAAALGALPAAIVFGYGFRGFEALVTLLVRWYII
jgi:hypothetical protein